MPVTRNDPLGFAGFAWKNFEFIEQAAIQSPTNEDLHPVTQLVLSMLGVIVLQREQNKIQFNQRVRKIKLVSPDWPQWKTMSPSCNTLGALVDNLRHAIAHGHVEFSSNSHTLSEVMISFRNPGWKGGPWIGEINAADLRTFCVRFKGLLEQMNVCTE